MSTPSIRPAHIEQSNLTLRPVLGEKRQERWKAVEEIVRNGVTPMYGDQSALLKNVVKEPELFKCRLLFQDEHPVGVVFYAGKTNRRYQADGLGKCVSIDMLYAKEGTESHLQALIDHVVKSAKGLKAEAICVRVPRDKGVRSFLENNGFHRLPTNDKILGKTLVERQKRESQGKEPPAKRHQNDDQPLQTPIDTVHTPASVLHAPKPIRARDMLKRRESLSLPTPLTSRMPKEKE